MTILIAIISFSILILIHELGHFLLAKKFNVFIKEFGLGLPPRIWGKKIGETIYSINWLPIGGFVNIAGENREGDEAENKDKEVKNKIPKERFFYNIKIWKRMAIISGGVIMNFLLGWFLITAVLMVNIAPAVFVVDIQKDSPAAKAGILPNDKILGFEAVSDFIGFTKINQGKEVNIKIERNGKEIDIKTKLREGKDAQQGAFGVSLVEGGHKKVGFFEAIKEGFNTSVEIIKMTLSALKGLITGSVGLKNVTGVVGISKATSEASKLGFVYLIQFLALISINLAVFNILPFPALDGGRLLFSIIEKIKGSPLPQKFEQYANAIGMALLLLLIFIITGHDIYRFFIK